MRKYKRAWQLTRQEAQLICDRQEKCEYCPLYSTNGCLRSVAGFDRQEINKKVEVEY